MSRLLRPMKPRSPLPLRKPLALVVAPEARAVAGCVVALLCLGFAARAAQTPAALPGHAQVATTAPSRSVPAATNALPLLVPIPQSVFIIPITPQEGKDPFFPGSIRIFNDVVVKTNPHPAAATAAVVAVELKLNGISGTADHRLAIINNRTFEIGEEGEVASNVGRVRIICKDIKADSVRVLVNNEERVLRLRPR